MKLRTQMTLLCTWVVLPVALSATFAVITIARQERQVSMRALSETARAIALHVDLDVQASISALLALGTSPALAAGDLRGFYEQARSLDRAPHQWTTLMTAEGLALVNTRMPFGRTPAVPQPDDHARLTRVLQEGKPWMSDVGLAPATRGPLTALHVPVPVANGRPYVLQQAFDGAYWHRLTEPEPGAGVHRLVSVLDRRGVFVVRGQQPDAHIGQTAPAELVAAARSPGSGVLQFRTMDGMRAYGAYSHSSLSGWTVIVAAPASEVEASSLRALVLGLVGAAITAAAIVLTMGRFGRRLVREIGMAREGARDVGEGRVPTLGPSHVAEIRELNNAICTASALLQSERQARIDAHARLERMNHEFQLAVLSEVEARQGRIARELHDSVGSDLAGISLMLEGLKGMVVDSKAHTLAKKAQEQAGRTAQAVRQISRGIMPAGTDTGALLHALDLYAKDLSQLQNIACTMRTRGSGFADIDAPTATHVYRIVQEAGNNAVRHGGATRLQLRLIGRHGRFRLSVTDNGAGYPIVAPNGHTSGVGVRSMHARAEAVGGTIAFHARPAGGCVVRVDWGAG